MSKDNKKKEEGSTFLIGIALAGLFIYKLNETAPHILWFLLLIPTVIAISLATGKRLDYRLNWVIPTITLGLILTFWGVPFSHTPLWNASNAFKNSEVGVPYFVKIDRIKDDLKYAKEEFGKQKSVDAWHNTMLETLEKFKNRKQWSKETF